MSQGRKIHFYQRGNWFLPPWSFTANADQSNGSITCAHVAGTKVLHVSQGWKIHFYQMWKLIFTTLEFTTNANQSNECYLCTQGGEQLILTPLEIDFYRRINWFLPPWKFIFTIVETAFYHHRKYIVNVWFHLNSLLWSPSMVNHPII